MINAKEFKERGRQARPTCLTIETRRRLIIVPLRLVLGMASVPALGGVAVWALWGATQPGAAPAAESEALAEDPQLDSTEQEIYEELWGRFGPRGRGPGPIQPTPQDVPYLLGLWDRVVSGGVRIDVAAAEGPLPAPSPRLRKVIVVYLGQTEDPSLLAFLDKVSVEDPDESVRRVARSAYERIRRLASAR
ncbi:MAG: hypothetical protein AB1486_09515 [Planctomycetota bacterium]